MSIFIQNIIRITTYNKNVVFTDTTYYFFLIKSLAYGILSRICVPCKNVMQ